MKANTTTFNLAASKKRASQDACAAQLWPNAAIAVVADGVGGAEYGREAAAKVVDSFVANFKSRPAAWSVSKALDEFTRLLNSTLYQESFARFERVEMLSTLAVVAIEGQTLYGANVGDSRIYLLHDGQLAQLSEDHTSGDAPLQHVLSRALGMAPDVGPHRFERTLNPGDIVLLCTDGVSNLLPPDALRSLLQRRASARTVIAAARETADDETLDDMAAVVMEIVELDKHSSGNPPLKVPESLVAGEVMDGFTLVRPLHPAERIWLALFQGAAVAVKFAPRQARGSEAIRNQFAKEIWSLTRLQADYFIRAFLPENCGTLCYCMEYLEAPALKQYLETRPLKVDAAIALGKFLLEASQFLLSFDLVHCDMKPENILVLPQGDQLRFKLIDFGSITEIFSVASRAGTPSYLAPERFRGAPVSERTEIFAIGVTLYEALTKSLPYGEIEPFQNPLFRTPKPPSQLNPNIPPWLESVILRAIAPKPENRYSNYSEVKFDLENPGRVKPFIRPDAPLLESNPILFYKIGCFVLLLLNLFLIFKLLLRK